MPKQHEPSNASEGDTYPLHCLDGLKVNYKFVSWTMRFNDVLDVEKLHNALSRLLEIGDWRKLGGRLRFKVWRKPFFVAWHNSGLTVSRRMESSKSMSHGPLRQNNRL